MIKTIKDLISNIKLSIDKGMLKRYVAYLGAVAGIDLFLALIPIRS